MLAYLCPGPLSLQRCRRRVKRIMGWNFPHLARGFCSGGMYPGTGLKSFRGTRLGEGERSRRDATVLRPEGAWAQQTRQAVERVRKGDPTREGVYSPREKKCMVRVLQISFSRRSIMTSALLISLQCARLRMSDTACCVMPSLSATCFCLPSSLYSRITLF